MRASDVIKHAFAAYRAWGGYLVFLTIAFYVVIATVGLFVNALLGHAGAQLLLYCANAWAIALVVDAVAAIEEPDADRSLGGRLAALAPYLGTLSVVAVLWNLLVGIGFFFLIVPGLVLVTRWAVVIPVIVLERTGIGAAFSRSKHLVSGRGMTVFWTLVMSYLLILVPACLVLGPVFLSASLPAMLAASVLYGGLVTPFIALCLVTLYSDLRARFAPPPSRTWA